MTPQDSEIDSGTGTPAVAWSHGGNLYPGGKSLAGLHQWIVARLPSHVYYAEPFAGKAGIFRNKVPALRSWLIDMDAEVIAWLQRQIRPGSIDSAGHGHGWKRDSVCRARGGVGRRGFADLRGPTLLAFDACPFWTLSV